MNDETAPEGGSPSSRASIDDSPSVGEALFATAQPPALVLVLRLESDEPQAIVDARSEGDALRLRHWLETSRHRDALALLVPRFIATGAAA